MKISVIQSDIIWENIPANLERFGRLIDNAPNSDLIVLPEMFATGFTMTPERFAQTETGSVMSFLKTKAAEVDAAVAASFACREAGKYYNRFVFVMPNGRFYRYDKRHLFSFVGEDKHYVAGNQRVIIQYKNFRMMPQVCYDLRFPVWSRVRNDYDLLLYVANWPERRRMAWRTLLQARAHENQAYVIGLNRVGLDGNGTEHSGDSLLVDPRGRLLIDIPDGKAQTVCCEINIEEVSGLRKKFPASRDADDYLLR